MPADHTLRQQSSDSNCVCEGASHVPGESSSRVPVPVPAVRRVREGVVLVLLLSIPSSVVDFRRRMRPTEKTVSDPARSWFGAKVSDAGSRESWTGRPSFNGSCASLRSRSANLSGPISLRAFRHWMGSGWGSAASSSRPAFPCPTLGRQTVTVMVLTSNADGWHVSRARHLDEMGFFADRTPDAIIGPSLDRRSVEPPADPAIVDPVRRRQPVQGRGASEHAS